MKRRLCMTLTVFAIATEKRSTALTGIDRIVIGK
jgi:hypothetical protein